MKRARATEKKARKGEDDDATRAQSNGDGVQGRSIVRGIRECLPKASKECRQSLSCVFDR